MDILFSFLSDHLTLIVAWNIFFAIGLVTVWSLAQWRSSFVEFSFEKAINSFLGGIFFILGFFGLGILLCLLIMNFSVLVQQKPLDFSARITGNTKWVKDHTAIYFFAGKKFFSIQPNGDDTKIIYESKAAIREYHFSPDGKSILILSPREIIQYQPATGQINLLEEIVFSPEEQQGMQGSIDGVRWDPQGKKFCYRLSKWSRYASSSHWYLYDVADKTKQVIKNQNIKFVDLEWSRDGESLYSLWFKAVDKNQQGYAFEIKVYKIPLATLIPELVLQIPYETKVMSKDALALHGIVLDEPKQDLSVTPAGYEGKQWVSPQGALIGIDEFDQLYYIRNALFKRRFYTIPRVDSPIPQAPTPATSFKYAIEELKWLPSGKYVIMAHSYLGVLILDPVSGKIGLLTNERGKGFGWYQPKK